MNLKKAQIRDQILQQLKKMDESSFTEKCKKIREHFVLTPLWRDASVIGITLSVAREVETMAIITRGWAEGKQMVVPKCDPQMHTLSFYRLQTFNQLTAGFYGLMEPDPLVTEKVNAQQIDLLVVPGIAFNEKGYRIGYGGGYYDRFLADYKGETVSLLFEHQLIAGLPVEGHDRRVNWLITEHGCRGSLGMNG